MAEIRNPLEIHFRANRSQGKKCFGLTTAAINPTSTLTGEAGPLTIKGSNRCCIEVIVLSPKLKIGLLVTAHVVAGFLLAWNGGLRNMYPHFALYALMSADVVLLVMWGAMGMTRFAWLPMFIVGTVYFWAVLAFPGIVPYSWHSVPIAAVVVLLLLISLRHSPRRLRMINLVNESPGSDCFQFSIRHLLGAMAGVAIALSLGRWGQAFGQEWRHTVFVAMVSLCVIAAELGTLWATLGIGRPWPRLAVVLPAAFMVAFNPFFFWNVPNNEIPKQFLILSGIIGGAAIITAASLLVVRSCGWRLVGGDRLQTEEMHAG